MPPPAQPSSSSRAPRRVGLSDIARELGVSVMTVSYALRHHTKIPKVTREKVQRVAARLGYMPNPEISRLMHLLRDELPPVQHANLGLLTFAHLGDPPEHSYSRAVHDGARRRAEQIGCAIDEVVVDIDRLSAKRASHILISRGIRGVLLPPMLKPLDCSKLLEWSRFAIVAATYSVRGLAVDRVVPHHFANCRLLFQRLLAEGHRRIGVAVGGDLESRFNDCHHAVYEQLRQRRQLKAVPWLVNPTPERTQRWLARYRPDVIVADSSYVRMLTKVCPVRLVLIDGVSDPSVAGIDQLPGEIGRSAVELLAGKVTRGEFGLPEHPQVTMVEGVWRG